MSAVVFVTQTPFPINQMKMQKTVHTCNKVFVIFIFQQNNNGIQCTNTKIYSHVIRIHQQFICITIGIVVHQFNIFGNKYLLFVHMTSSSSTISNVDHFSYYVVIVKLSSLTFVAIQFQMQYCCFISLEICQPDCTNKQRLGYSI